MTHYTGSQWTVTDYGLEQRNGNYRIRAQDLSMGVGPGGWPAHMASKNWVDVGDFVKAFEIAKKVHQ